MKKGFTLVELMAVIAILALLAAISYPILTGVLKDATISADESQAKLIEEAAKYWANDNSYLLSDEVGDTYIVTMDDLKEGYYLDDVSIVDIENDELLESACVKITTLEHRYNYEFQKHCESNAN